MPQLPEGTVEGTQETGNLKPACLNPQNMSPPRENAGISLPERLPLRLYAQMVRIRQFEERVAELLESEEITCPTHLYIGQEAVAVGVCEALDDRDHVLGNHRSHGHFIAKGGGLDELMAELYCRETGCSKGRGGSMHLIDRDVGMLGTVPIVAATIPVAVGAALTAKMTGEDRVAVAFFGDSATEEGLFHESLNFAALYDLPVVFVCENNYFSSHLRLQRRRPVEDLSNIADGYAVPTKRLDGNDVLEVYGEASEAVRRARAGDGPTFLECVTHRWRGHVGPSDDLDVGLRSQDELDYWQARCPINRLENDLRTHPDVEEEALDSIRADVTTAVEDSVEFARNSPHPDPDSVTDDVFVEPL